MVAVSKYCTIVLSNSADWPDANLFVLYIFDCLCLDFVLFVVLCGCVLSCLNGIYSQLPFNTNWKYGKFFLYKYTARRGEHTQSHSNELNMRLATRSRDEACQKKKFITPRGAVSENINIGGCILEIFHVFSCVLCVSVKLGWQCTLHPDHHSTQQQQRAHRPNEKWNKNIQSKKTPFEWKWEW